MTDEPSRAAGNAPLFGVDQSTREAALWTDWISFWNGHYNLAADVVAPAFKLHANLLGGQNPNDFNDPASMAGLIEQIRTAIPDLVFTVIVGPIIADGYVVGHWNASGRYAGHFPGATVEVGTEVSFDGTDILRVEGGKMVEYWLVSDNLGLVTQLGLGQ